VNIKNIINRYVVPMASLPTFNDFIGNSDPTARDLKSAARMAGEDIARRGEWTDMLKTVVIDAGESSYALPDDYHRVIQGSPINHTEPRYGPVPYIRANDVWSHLVDSPSTTQTYFAIRNGFIKFLPALTHEVRFRYISKNWIVHVDGSEDDDWTSDDDEPLFSEHLLALGTLANYLQAKGRPYQDWADRYEARLEMEIKADRGIS
jgi:hypothetical protein